MPAAATATVSPLKMVKFSKDVPTRLNIKINPLNGF